MIWSAIAWGLASMILACLIVAIVTDVMCRIIPNRLVLIVLCGGIALRALSGVTPLLTSLMSGTAILAVLSVLGAKDLLGWGDVKLITAVTFIVPANRVIPLLFAITLAGGLLSCVYLTVRFALRRASRFRPNAAGGLAGAKAWPFRALVRQEAARILRDEPMPYALAIVGGVAYGLTAG
jgi:prepilin peptidase CpaA